MTGDAPTKVDTLPFPDSICHRCASSRTVATKTSKFLLCTALTTKYPRQPIVKCPAFEADRRR